MAKKIGITMRVTLSRHGETRDCVAREWVSFMATTLPSASWILLPNSGEAIIEQVANWGLDGFIFSGGNDVGQCLERDATEHALLKYALQHNHPVFGVCRGLQYLQSHFGGPLEPCSYEKHVATHHPVSVFSERLEFDASSRAMVNSYHEWAIIKPGLASELEILATSDDGCVEAIRHREAPIVAVQWHPERENSAKELDRNLIHSILG